MNILKSKIDKGLILKTLFIKTAISCLCPYESSGIMNFDNVQTSKLAGLLRDFDPIRLDTVNSPEDLIELLVRYFEGRIMEEFTYKKVLISLSLTIQGLSKDEVMQIVILINISLELLKMNGVISSWYIRISSLRSKDYGRFRTQFSREL